MNQLSLSSTSTGCGGILESLSGVTKIQIADVEWIDEFPEIITAHKYQTDVTFLPTFGWLDITPIVNSASYDDNGKHKNGVLFSVACSLDIAGDTAEKSAFINDIVRKCIVAKIHFKNGTKKLIGDFGLISNPVLPTSKSSIGSKASDPNLHTINLDWITTDKPYFID